MLAKNLRTITLSVIDTMPGIPLNLKLALLSAVVLGFRHGFDYDHIAAITYITSVQRKRSKAMQLGMIYALGHAMMVLVLGSAVIFFQLSLPKSIDDVAERLVGITLIVLGLYVLYAFFRPPAGGVPLTRFALILRSFEWCRWKIGRLLGSEAERPVASAMDYGTKTTFIIGAIHGLGAETPSQLMVFLLAANLGGLSLGFLGLAMFIAGLLIMNGLMTAFTTGIFGLGRNRIFVTRALAGLGAIYSIAVGFIFVIGSSARLPSLR